MSAAPPSGGASASGPSRHSGVRIAGDPWWMLVDPFFVLSIVSIAGLGTLLVYSATRGAADEFNAPDASFLKRQALFAVVGLALGAVTCLVEPRRVGQFWPVAYAATLIALAAVAAVGVEVNGTRGWFAVAGFTFQPSEPAKVVLIGGLARLLSPSGRDDVGVGRMGAGLAMVAVPTALVMLQPDLGTVLVYLMVTLAMIVASGVGARWIACLVFLAVFVVVGVLRSDVLADYQQARLTVFLLDPDEITEQAAAYAYNAEQAQIAIGNGGLTGQGLFQGTQTRSQLVPAQHTDFIFTVAGEELGLRGAAALLGLYAVLLLRIWRTAFLASLAFGRMVCVGVFAMFAFQMFQAVGMTMGMMPVTGIPMPLVSYGGSSMLTSMVALGLVAGVYRRREQFDEMRA